MIEESREKISFFKERRSVSFLSGAFILSYMFYVILISLLINFVLEPVLEPLYIAFQNSTSLWDITFILGTVAVTFIYTLLNIVMISLSYKTVFYKWKISKESAEKFVMIIAFIFPILLFLFSYFTEREFFPLILNTLSQIIVTYLFKSKIKISE